MLDEDQACYGALRATLELARRLMRGSDVTLVADDITKKDFYKIPVLKERNFSEKLRKSAGTIIQISRGDYLTQGCINVISQHGPHHIRRLNNKDLKHLNAVICVSKFSRKQQIEYGIPDKILHAVTNGIDASIFKFKFEDRRPASFIYAGHIISYKGIVLALRAFMEIFKYHPEASFHLYGKNLAWNKDDDGESWLRERDYLDEMSRIDWNQVSKDCPSIHYGGEVTQEELASHLNRNAYVICCSLIPETFGLVSLEAQACGCIPIIANQGGYPETIMHSTPSFTFEPGNYRSLVRTMLRAVSEWSNGLERSQIAQEAGKLSWNISCKKTEAVIQKVHLKNKIRLEVNGLLDKTLQFISKKTS